MNQTLKAIITTCYLSLSGIIAFAAGGTYDVYSNAPNIATQNQNHGALSNATARMADANGVADEAPVNGANANDRILAFKSLAQYQQATNNPAAALPQGSADLGTYEPANGSNVIAMTGLTTIPLVGPQGEQPGQNTTLMQNLIQGTQTQANNNATGPVMVYFMSPQDPNNVRKPIQVPVTNGDGGIVNLNLFGTKQPNVNGGMFTDETFYLTGTPAVAAVGQAPTGNQNLILSQNTLPQGTDASDYTFTGSVAGADANGNATLGGTLVKKGDGILILGQNAAKINGATDHNTINMQTVNVQGGILIPAVLNMFAFDAATATVPQTVANIPYGSTLKLDASQTFAGLTSSGNANLGGNLDLNANQVTVVVPTGTTQTFNGLISNSNNAVDGGVTVALAAAAGAPGIQDIRIGSGLTAATDVNTYSGATAVYGNLIADSRSLPINSTVTLYPGSTLTFDQSNVTAAIATANRAQNQLPATATTYDSIYGIAGEGKIKVLNSPEANPLTLTGAPSTFTGAWVVGTGQQLNVQRDNYFQGANGNLPSIENNGKLQLSGVAAQGNNPAQVNNYSTSSLNSVSGPTSSEVLLNNAHLSVLANGATAPFNNNGTILSQPNTTNTLIFGLSQNFAGPVDNTTTALRTFNVVAPIGVNSLTANTNTITSIQGDGFLDGTPVTLNQGSILLLNDHTVPVTNLTSNEASIIDLGQTYGVFTGTYSNNANFNAQLIGKGIAQFIPADATSRDIIWGGNGAVGSTFTGLCVQSDPDNPANNLNITLAQPNMLSPNAVYQMHRGTLTMGANNQTVRGLSGSDQSTIDMNGSTLTIDSIAGISESYVGNITARANNKGTVVKIGAGTQSFTGASPLSLAQMDVNEGQLVVNSTVLSTPVAPGAVVAASTALVGPNAAPASGTPTVSFQQGANDAAIPYINPVNSLSGALNFNLASGNLTVQGELPTYIGATTIAAGSTLNTPVEGWFENTNVAAPFILNGILDLAGQDQLVNNLQGSAQAIVQNTNAAGTTNIFSINQLIGNADGSVSQFEGNITTNIDFHKSGLFPVALAGNNSYIGSTVVDQGLLYANTNSLPNNSTVILNTPAFAYTNDAVNMPTAFTTLVRQIDTNNLHASGLEGLVFNQTGTTTYSATENVFNGSFRGTGDIIKIGTGALNLTGDFTQWSNLNKYNILYILQGTVAMNGYMPNGRIYVGNGAILKGGAPNLALSTGFMMPGVWVDNGGTFAPGNSIGYTPIQFLTLSPESIFKVEISSTGASTQVASVGDVDLDGILVIIPANDGEYNVGTEYLNVITTQGELNGTFNTISILGFKLSNPNDFITYVKGPNGSVSLTLTQEAVNAIAAINDQNIPRFAESNAFLAMSSLGQQKNLFANRMSLLSSSPEYATGVWATPYWNTMRLKSKDGTVACKSNTEGFTFGKDMIIENGALLGAALGYENTHAKYKNDSAKANMNSLHAGIYANYEIEQIHFEAVVSGLVSRNKYKRDVSVKTATIQSDVGQNKGKNYSFGGEVSLLVGYVMPYEAASFMPYVGVNFYGTRENKFTETSTKQLFSTIKRRNTASIEEELGLRTDVKFGRVSLLTDVSIARSHFIHDSGSKSLYQDSTKIDQSRNLRYNYPIEVRALLGMGYKHSNTISYELAAGVKARRSKFETSLMGSISIAM